MQTLFRFLLLAWSATACGQNAIADADLDVWAALVNHGLGPDVPIVVIAEQTTGDPAALAGADDAEAVVREMGAPAATLANWLLRNQTTSNINQSLNLNVSYQMLNAATLAEMFADVEPAAGWEAFFQRYPGAPGLLRLSLAGFDPALTEALVYVEYQCGPACGSGRLIYLHAGSGAGWEVKNAALVWMAE